MRLRKPRNEVERDLTEQVEIGQRLVEDLFGSRWYTGRSLVDDLREADRFRRYVYAMLLQQFTSPEIADEFASIGKKFFRGPSPILRSSAADRIMGDIREEVAYLQGLQGQLKLYEEPSEMHGEEGEGLKGRPIYKVVFKISGGTFGQLGTTITNMNTRIAAIGGEGRPQLAEGLQHITQAVIDAPELNEDLRTALIDNLDDLSEQAVTPVEQRKGGRIRGAIAIISAAATASTQLQEAWNAWGPTIEQLVPR